MVIRALSYDLPLILAFKIHRLSKADALKWFVFIGDSIASYNIGGTHRVLCRAISCRCCSLKIVSEIIVFKKRNFRNTVRLSKSMDPDKAHQLF